MSETLRVTWVGHSTVVIDVAGVRLVTDPLLRRHAGLLRRRGGAPSGAWRGSDAVLLSHLHLDHAEVASLRMLPDAPVLAAPENVPWLERHGLRGVALAPDEWTSVGDATGAGRVEVRSVPAVHGDRPMPHRPNGTIGHLVRWSRGDDRAVVWALGDTEAYPAMADVAALAGAPVDLALVPVSGWGPRLSGGHLGPAQAAQVCADAGVRAAVPVHWGTLHVPGGRWLPRGWMDVPGLAFGVALADRAPGCRPVVLAPGQAWEVPVGR
ncbi:L-ascorbate metabolism protein UlaG (beta-lactamase superfamily) [Sediminihabitans luteus]|uniref:L-ascorbate metabolism protein UlaG (Beta-lactamase superfamily) n=1 Tax=Sediminihabitans luteus TaxID=1138585 RepID=A0A2M9CCF4_9CELL|nr:MBL fold metallo-hydrolase [Sediminihabitans luteus]PJJ69040.1 L-ascorbate metabolism protein UlaG (beta-lactamase superfamily) [Sediminihabitans luteus]GII99426.1 hypothetical protein Slu03_18040 [Sediminihabitans luteus]